MRDRLIFNLIKEDKKSFCHASTNGILSSTFMASSTSMREYFLADISHSALNSGGQCGLRIKTSIRSQSTLKDLPWVSLIINAILTKCVTANISIVVMLCNRLIEIGHNLFIIMDKHLMRIQIISRVSYFGSTCKEFGPPWVNADNFRRTPSTSRILMLGFDKRESMKS